MKTVHSSRVEKGDGGQGEVAVPLLQMIELKDGESACRRQIKGARGLKRAPKKILTHGAHGCVSLRHRGGETQPRVY